jgi:hypothetical protein
MPASKTTHRLDPKNESALGLPRFDVYKALEKGPLKEKVE